MNTKTAWTLLLSALLATTTATAVLAAEEVAPAAVEVLSAEFGIFDASDSREVAFGPTRVVPHREGQRYGWVIFS